MTEIELKPVFSRAPHCRRLIAPDVRASDALARELKSISSSESLPYGYARAVIPPTLQAVCHSVFTYDGDEPGEGINIPVVDVSEKRYIASSEREVTLGPCPAGKACGNWDPK